MKAAVFKGAGHALVIEELADPEPGAGEVVLKVHRCGICGTDLHMTDGHSAAFSYPAGTVPGHEFAGEVVAIGKDVRHLKVGDPISAMPFTGCGHCINCLAGRPSLCPEFRGMAGGFSEYLVTTERSAIQLPKSLSFDDGALVEPLAVGLHGVTKARMTPGARVLVIGAGPVGLAAIFFARQLGAGRIAVSAPSPRREALAMSMGADAFILPEPGQNLAEQVAQTLGGQPDVVFECAGQPGCIEQSIFSVRPAGTVVVMGFCTASDAFVPAMAVWKEINLRFSNTYSLGEFEQVARVLDRGAVEPRQMITQTVSLAELPDVFESLRQRSGQCKVLVNPWAP